MPKGLSLHIGIDFVDTKHYGYAAELPNCVNDAKAMQKLAAGRRFETHTLFNEDANSRRLYNFMHEAAHRLEPNDILFISFSGHGSYMHDINGDEKGEADETWLLHDRMIVDDELYQMWAKFKPRVRIIVISDSCHSGSITKNTAVRGPHGMHTELYMRSLLDQSKKIYLSNKHVYDSYLQCITSKKQVPLVCSVILISACRDDQRTPGRDPRGKGYSFFTYMLLLSWNDGLFQGNYAALRLLITLKSEGRTEPQYSLIGPAHSYFENQQPFTI